MELFLNILWGAFAIVCLSHWLKAEHRHKRDRHVAFVALFMLVVVLFPVISVSDDLWSIQNPAEADSFARRDTHASAPQSLHHAAAALPEVATTECAIGLKASLILSPRQAAGFSSPFVEAIRNRPPPRA